MTSPSKVRREETVVIYHSLREFVESLPARGCRPAYSFNGNQSFRDARENLYKGNHDAVERSDAVLEQLESDGIELKQEAWDTDLLGYFPCVPAAVQGDPDCMFTPIDEASTTAPMRVFASVCLSGGFPARDAEKRGVAILALVRKLALIRPVELWVYSDQQGRQPCIRLETMPLDLTTASYVLADVGFLRQLCFTWGEDGRGFEGAWARWSDALGGDPREALGAQGDDLVIPGAYLNRDDLSKPVEWVNRHVAKYTQALTN